MKTGVKFRRFLVPPGGSVLTGNVPAAGTMITDGRSGPFILFNQDPTSTIYISDDPSVSTDVNNGAPIAPGGNMVCAGNHPLFAIAQPFFATARTYPGATFMFVP